MNLSMKQLTLTFISSSESNPSINYAPFLVLYENIVAHLVNFSAFRAFLDYAMPNTTVVLCHWISHLALSIDIYINIDSFSYYSAASKAGNQKVMKH